MLNWARKHFDLLIPVLLMGVYAAPLITALLPDTTDELNESYEPLKTLVFIYTRGTLMHQYGPMPHFLYGPFYGIFLGYWYLKGEFTRPFGAIFTSLAHPFEQIGTLLFVARLIGLVVVLAAVAIYTRSLEKTARSKMAGMVAIILCIATAPDLIYSAVATKPDGLMLAFLATSMAAYALIVSDGFTFRRGVVLVLSTVASISCKEEMAPAYLAIYAWLLFSGLRRGRSFWIDFGKMAAVGTGAYLVINVIYAPVQWVDHIKYFIGGPGEDASVWANFNYSRADYLKDLLTFIGYNLGPGGSAVVILALISSAFHRSRVVLAAWIPLLAYVAFFAVRHGYMPRHYLLPVTILAALPVALQLAALQREEPPLLRRAATAIVIAAVVLNLWAGNMAWAKIRQVTPWMIEQYAAANLNKQVAIHLANPWKVRAGSTRLEYLGYRVDSRPLGELMKHPDDLPAVILVARDWEDFLLEFKKRPARTELYNDTGYSYDKFDGMESLGYRLADTVHPQIPVWLEPPWLWWPPNRVPGSRDLLVYRRAAAR